MITVNQRVTKAEVRAGGRPIGAIQNGLVVLLGVAQDDSENDVAWMVEKILTLRIMADGDGKMNRSALESGGALLVVPQFTLLADTTAGRRPFFGNAADPHKGKALYELFIEEAQKRGVDVQTGEFGAHMEVELVNDGPVTIILNSKE